MTAEEYFDSEQNKATVKMISQATESSMIYDYANDQIYYVQGNVTRQL